MRVSRVDEAGRGLKVRVSRVDEAGRGLKVRVAGVDEAGRGLKVRVSRVDEAGRGLNVRVAGVDEAGRGPLAGPVVAAAVILQPGRPLRGVADSKLLGARTRAQLNVAIRRRALCFGLGWADAREIDALNILQATFLAMRRAVLAMACRPDVLLVDGDRLPALSGLGGEVRARAIIGGDASLAAISAASILAKTARDHFMNEMHAVYPEYGFASHKGYPTALHRRRLAEHGPCPLHRRSFAPVGCLIDGTQDAAHGLESAPGVLPVLEL